MKLYIDNLEIRVKQAPVVRNKVQFKSIEEKWNSDFLHTEYSVLITDEDEFAINDVIKSLIELKSKVFKRITFVVNDLKLFKEFMKDEFKSVPAAGGLVEKYGELLVIKRHGLWDIPKGKIEKDEKLKVGAVREVEEECGVTVDVGEKIGKTLHFFKKKGRYCYKYTHWFKMKIVSEKNMKPQRNEGIEEVRWMSHEEVVLMDTYSSITGILEKYYDEIGL
tara:strand:- start:120 stop:782 length:663 start_codon:yes stop_codon:yes gene_type:complete